MDKQLGEETEQLRETRELVASQTALVSDLRFALNTIMLDFLGIDCALTDDIGIINKLVVRVEFGLVAMCSNQHLAWLRCCLTQFPWCLQTKVLNRIAVLVRFAASLLAADKTPVQNVVEEATKELVDADVTVDQHFIGRTSRSPSPSPSPSHRLVGSACICRRNSRSLTSAMYTVMDCFVLMQNNRPKDQNVRVKTDAELEIAQKLAAMHRDEVCGTQCNVRLSFGSTHTPTGDCTLQAAEDADEPPPRLTYKLSHRVIAGLSDDEDEDSNRNGDPMSRSELKRAAVKRVARQEAAELRASERRKKEEHAKPPPSYAQSKELVFNDYAGIVQQNQAQSEPASPSGEAIASKPRFSS